MWYLFWHNPVVLETSEDSMCECAEDNENIESDTETLKRKILYRPR